MTRHLATRRSGSAIGRASALSALLILAGSALAAAATVAELTGQLQSEDAQTRRTAALTLAEKGPAAADAAPALKDTLADDEPLVRAHAARALGKIGEAAKPFTADLVKLMGDESPLVRRAAVQALAQIQPDPQTVLDALIAGLRDPDPAVVMRVLNMLSDLEEPPLPLLKKALEHPQSQYWALLAVADMKKKAASLEAGVVPLCESESPTLRLQALIALAEIQADSDAAVTTAARCLEDQEMGCQIAAAFAIGRLGKASEETQAKLEELAKSENQFLATTAVWALAKLHPDDEAALTRALDTLMDALLTGDSHVRAAAAKALVELKPPRELVAPRLKEVFAKASPEVTDDLIVAAAGVGPEVVPRLILALEDDELRGVALKTMIRMGAIAAPAVEPLIRIVNESKDPETIAEAQFALGRIGPESAPAIDALIANLKAEDMLVRRSATYALGKIGPKAEAAVDAIKDNLNEDNQRLKAVSIFALLQIQPKNVRVTLLAIPILLKGLGDEGELVRYECATALGDIGRLAGQASKRLEEMAEDDPSPMVREAAAEALEKLQKRSGRPPEPPLPPGAGPAAPR